MSVKTRACSLLALLTAMGMGFISPLSQAADYGGIALGATRVVYPEGSTQSSLPINNTDAKDVFLVQSWIQNADGKKSSDFVVTPPLFVIKPQKENTLRIMYVGPGNLPKDRETLYWMNVKAIPAANKNIKDKNTLQIAVLNRIKVFVRPEDLPMKSVEAPAKLRFHQDGSSLIVKNSTPYYITLVQFNDGTASLPATMVPPMGQSTVTVPKGAKGTISFQTVNDYGANTPKQNAVME